MRASFDTKVCTIWGSHKQGNEQKCDKLTNLGAFTLVEINQTVTQYSSTYRVRTHVSGMFQSLSHESHGNLAKNELAK